MIITYLDQSFPVITDPNLAKVRTRADPDYNTSSVYLVASYFGL